MDKASQELAKELYKGEPWKGQEQVELATLSWINWFNYRQLLSSIGDIPPVAHEEFYYRQQSDDQAA